MRISLHVIEIAFNERMLFTVVALNKAEIKQKTLEEHLRRDAVGIEELTDLRIEVDRQALPGPFARRPDHGTRPGLGGDRLVHGYLKY